MPRYWLLPPLCALVWCAADGVAQTPPDPIDLYRAAAQRLVEAQALSVHVEKRFDVVLNDGAKVEYSGALDVLSVPARGLFMDYGDDMSAKRVWYDGRKLTLLDTLENFYVSVPVEGTVAAALTAISRDYDVEMPLAPLLKKNLVEDLESRTQASYLGIHDAEGEPCHHLLFRGETLDMQVWITDGELPELRKLVVTFWDIEAAPQQSLTFSDWDFAAEIDPGVFEARLPEGAMAISFVSEGGE